MNTRYQTRQQIKKPSVVKTPSSVHDYNTRFQSRLHNRMQKCNCDCESISTPKSPTHRYNTRYSKGIYPVNIDFDEASKAWNKNKRRVGQMYEYK